MGKVEDLLLDKMDRVAFVIIGRGGVLGVNENYIPIPWEKLGLGENRETAAVSVAIDATKAQLEKAPLVKGDNYATMLAPVTPPRCVSTSACQLAAPLRARQDAQALNRIASRGRLGKCGLTPEGRALFP